nr:immunoglobulin heavy chain junction region [Macaca mulatta]MOV49274.1 immunoglobulin heavy chain junction region [Macaca mulatta]MOV49383.1 immunoglobulin heavy chain junction region [Macaca mulatta]MOV49477.1 immunoglobulin heavy chain junction region [Macaca mulatta]MOV49629.1 immunoglobulin heavy chain junction region [Macaca mulatta]
CARDDGSGWVYFDYW